MGSATTLEQKNWATALRRMRLVVVSGTNAGLTAPIEGEVLVGTSEASDVRLDDRTASRRHLLLRPCAVGVRVVDQDSRNGTWIGQQRVHDAEVPPGTEIRVGETTLRLEDEVRTEAEIAKKLAAREPAASRGEFGRFLGASEVLAKLYERLERVAKARTTVLIEGESGTGKELLAEALHEQSPRSDGPFVIVDCAAIPETLIEAQLFGHERGSYTGADRARAGVFEEAEGGTVFLDEIGELPLELQAKLLRVIDRGHVTRIGASRPVTVDVRILAATNRNLEREVEDGRFRLDLFHRLAVVLLRVPPLRERDGDLELLARAFLEACGGDPSLLTEPLLDRLRRHSWPGNVRELRNYVERLVVLGEAELPRARADAIGEAGDPATSGLPYRQARALALREFTEAYVDDMLLRHDGNVSAAAEAAGVGRRYFQRLKGAVRDEGDADRSGPTKAGA